MMITACRPGGFSQMDCFPMLLSKLRKFAAAEDGATSIEYALIAVIISICIVAAGKGIATSLNGTFGKVADGMAPTN